MDIGIVGGGINGLCTAWLLAEQGHQVTVYERGAVMGATSGVSSKLLHGGLRYLENGEFRLVREALRERDAWITRAPQLAKPLRITMPIYRTSRRSAWMVAAGLFLYDHMAGKSLLPKAKRLTAAEICTRDTTLNPEGLLGGFEFSDGQMDDRALGLWVAQQAGALGVCLEEQTEVLGVQADGTITTVEGTSRHDRVLNIAGPWAIALLDQSGIPIPYRLDLVRGSHLLLQQPCEQAYLLEAPKERRIFFVLPWKGGSLLGTTEVRQLLNEPITCTEEEEAYLLHAYRHYFPASEPLVTERFAGLRPLLYSAQDPNKATREYAIHRTENLITVLGGKWTTAMALARTVSQRI
ncbi:MAG: FAD-dependent oxidoreductase [Gammaproteobacteria bacterium]|nr:FAD-dependent oxidoreductase [Gammaproteobacteria bacterium]